MAVMGRIAGLPTRYVEGYFARPGEGGQTVLTGQDAHAWAEVYFRGLGWVPFDATNGGPGSRGQDQSGDGADSGASGDAGDSDEPNATPEPDGGEGRDGQSDEPDDPNDPESDGDDSPDEPSDTPTPEPPRPDDTPEPPQDDPSGQEEWDFTKDAPRRHGWLIALGIILLLLVIALAVLWVRRRLKRTSPVYLCGQTKSAQKASMIAYRANLTLLNHMGQAPVSGEAPEAFAQRVSKQLDNPDYAAFVRAVTLSRYGRRPLKKEDIQAGLRAYLVFEKGMRRSERLRFGLTRVFRGIGDFESIP